MTRCAALGATCGLSPRTWSLAWRSRIVCPVSSTVSRRGAARLVVASARVHAEVLDEERPGLTHRLLVGGAVPAPVHAEIGVMVNVVPEERSAVALVGAGVEDVGISESVNVVRGADESAGINHIEREEPAVERLHVVDLVIDGVGARWYSAASRPGRFPECNAVAFRPRGSASCLSRPRLLIARGG